jgi:hypothetical protein
MRLARKEPRISQKPQYEAANKGFCLSLIGSMRFIHHVENDHERRLGPG